MFMQGGTVFIEVKALGMLFGCLASYAHCIMGLLSAISISEFPSDVSETSGTTELEHPSEGSLNIVQDAYQNMIDHLFLDVSQFFFVILSDDSSGFALY